jgi:hypothetical protein
VSSNTTSSSAPPTGGNSSPLGWLGWNPVQTFKDLFISPVVNIYTGIVNWLNAEGSLLQITRPDITYANAAVQNLWKVMLGIVDAVLTIILLIAGYNIMVGAVGLRYAAAVETIPRVLLAALGANISMVFVQFWIDFNNVLCETIVSHMQVGGPMPAVDLANLLTGNLGGNLAIGILLMILGVLVILLAVQLIIRLALVNFLIVTSPLGFICWSLPQTQQWARLWISGFLSAVLVQFFQLTCLALGANMLHAFLALNVGPTTTTLAPISAILVAMALLFLTLKIPTMLQSWVLRPMSDGSRNLSLAAVGAAWIAARAAVIASI